MKISEKAIQKLLKALSKRSGGKTSCSVVIAAAGSSERMSGEDKLFVEICGIPVLGHTLMAFQSCGSVSEIIIVTREDRLEQAGLLCRNHNISKAKSIMVGGRSRLESVLRGVLAVSEDSQLIAIHDGARPCVEEAVILKAIEAAAVRHAVAPAVKVSSTVKKVKDGIVSETVDREDLVEIQTPQVFAAEIIKAALTNALSKSLEVTDDCMAAEIIGVPVYIIEGSRSNIKITTKEDIAIVEAILGKRQEGASAQGAENKEI